MARFDFTLGGLRLHAIAYRDATELGSPWVGDRILAWDDWPWPAIGTITRVDVDGRFWIRTDDGSDWRHPAWWVARLRRVRPASTPSDSGTA
jgi:hypothetical protein